MAIVLKSCNSGTKIRNPFSLVSSKVIYLCAQNKKDYITLYQTNFITNVYRNDPFTF